MTNQEGIVVFSLLWLWMTTSGGEAVADTNLSEGKWEVLLENIGIVAMHIQLLHNDKVVIFDRTDFGLSNISLPNGSCRDDPGEKVLQHDCSAHSVEYDVVLNSVRPLMVQTNVWCSSGAVTSDGVLVQTGGTNDGDLRVRLFSPCAGYGDDSPNCGEWKEEEEQYDLIDRRWYATNHILQDGRHIIVGGRNVFSHEFYPSSNIAYSLPFLYQTYDTGEENNLYPFVFLNVDGNLFILANNRSVLFDYVSNQVVRRYPDIPDGHPRCFPATGSAVLLPLKSATVAEVLVCGGAPRGAYLKAANGSTFVEGLDTCARMEITDPDTKWVMEKMPMRRLMGDMVILADANVLIVNGAASGAAGWDCGREPVLTPVLYQPDKLPGSRFLLQTPSNISRMYHSTAALVRDGRVLIAGSNPHEKYKFSDVLFPTELRLEAFSPSYLHPKMAIYRPTIVTPASQARFRYNDSFPLCFTVEAGAVNRDLITVALILPPFTTHSFSMNQRYITLVHANSTAAQPAPVAAANTTYHQIDVIAPSSPNLAPPGYYLLFIVHPLPCIPSEGIWIHIR